MRTYNYGKCEECGQYVGPSARGYCPGCSTVAAYERLYGVTVPASCNCWGDVARHARHSGWHVLAWSQAVHSVIEERSFT